MLAVYLSLFGAKALSLGKPLMALVTLVSVTRITGAFRAVSRGEAFAWTIAARVGGVRLPSWRLITDGNDYEISPRTSEASSHERGHLNSSSNSIGVDPSENQMALPPSLVQIWDAKD
jgi:hypothetical protein